MPIRLTSIYEDGFETAFRKTPSGMAHLYGTGPSGETCRTCGFFEFSGHYSPNNGGKANMLKPGRCRRYKQIMKRSGPPIKPNLAACKYFEQNPAPPPTTYGRG